MSKRLHQMTQEEKERWFHEKIMKRRVDWGDCSPAAQTIMDAFVASIWKHHPDREFHQNVHGMWKRYAEQWANEFGQNADFIDRVVDSHIGEKKLSYEHPMSFAAVARETKAKPRLTSRLDEVEDVFGGLYRE
jgi:hypothetical protein